MSDIIHDPTRGWLLLTEKWPEKTAESTIHKSGGVCPACRHEQAVAHCLSTAIEIAKEDWDQVKQIVMQITCEEWGKNHHPYSVDAEFEVKEQWRRKGADTTRENSNQWEDFTPPTATKQSFNDYRQIARLVKAKEKFEPLYGIEINREIFKPTDSVTSDGSKWVEPNEWTKHGHFETKTESQDELWKDLIDVYDVEDRKGYGYATLIKALSARFRIERI